VEAEEMVEQAQMQAHQQRGEAKQQADEILAGARAEAAKRLEEGEQKLSGREEEAQQLLNALREEIDAARAARARLLEELRQTAADLEDLAGAMVARGEAPEPVGESSDPPTEKVPRKAVARPPRGDEPTEPHHGRPLTPAAAAARERRGRDGSPEDPAG
jgi:hypothetical protein